MKRREFWMMDNEINILDTLEPNKLELNNISKKNKQEGKTF